MHENPDERQPRVRPSERKSARTNRLHAVLSTIVKTVLSLPEREELFAEVCRITTTTGGYRLAWIGWPGADGALHPVARAGKALEYLDNPAGAFDPVDVAFRTGLPVVVPDFLGDRRTASWAPAAARHGLTGCGAFPLRHDGRVAGVLSVYGAEPGAFRRREMRLLEEVAGHLSLALDRLDVDAARKRMERHNRELATVVASSDDAIASRTLDGIITSWNPGAEKIFGYSEAEAVGHAMADLVLPPGLDEEVESINTQLRRNEPVPRLETVRRRRDGSLIDVALTISPLRDRQGQTVGAVTVARDITEHKRAETALRFFRSVIDSSNDAVEVIHPVTGRFLDVNQRACQMLGYTRDELLGMTMFEVSMQLQSDPSTHAKIGARLAQTGHVTVEDRHRRKDGTTFPVEVSISNAGPDREYGITIVRDITERMEAEQALRESQALYHALVEQMPAGLYRKDASGRYVFANSTFMAATGFSTQEFLGRSAPEVASLLEDWVRQRRQTGDAPAIFTRGMEHHARIMRTGEPIEEDIDWRRPDGEPQHFHVVKTPVRDAAGRIVGSQGMIFDITARRQAEAVLARHDAILNAATFAAGRFLHSSNWRGVVDEILARAGTAADVSRAYVFERRPSPAGDLVVSQTFEWVAPGVRPEIANPDLQNLSLARAGLGRWAEIFLRGAPLDTDVCVLPEAERPILEAEDIRSILVVPVMLDGGLWGLIGFDECRRERRWHEAEIEALRTLCELLGAAIRNEQTEKTIRQLSMAVEQSPVSIVITDPTGAIQYANAKFLAVTGYRFDEVRGKNPRLLKSGRNPESLYRDLWSTVIAGREWRGELCNRKKNGELYWEYATISPLLDEAGRVTHYVAVKEDITARRQADTALRESEYFLTKSQEVAHVGSYRLNVSDHTWSCTPEMERIFGIDRGFPKTDETWLDLIVPEQREEIRNYLRQAVTERRRFEREYQIVRCSDQQVRWIAGTGEIESDDQGRPVRMIGTVQDITERRQTDARLRRTQRLESIGTMAGGVAHDLNNILTPILMGIPLLRLDLTGNPQTQHLLDTMEASVRRGAQVIRQILIFSRGVEVAKVPLQSRQVVREVAAIVEQTFPKNITVEGRFPHDLPPVEGDVTQLHQVFMNLCINARDAMPEGGTLTLTAEAAEIDAAIGMRQPDARPGRYVVWTVADTGCGIKAEILERIFEPFYTTKGTGKGTGLGLSTALGIVRSHAGFMTVTSEIGRGSQFRVFLPVADAAAMATRPPVNPTSPTGHGELVLLVDDEFAVRQMTEHVLQNNAYRVLAADSGLKALDLYRAHAGECAMMITDLIMPGMSGAELIRLLRSINPKLKIIAVSGYVARNENGTSQMDVVADAFLAKPYTVDDLLRTVHQVLADRG